MAEGDTRRRFLVAACVLVVLCIAALAGAWWMLADVAEKAKAQQAEIDGVVDRFEAARAKEAAAAGGTAAVAAAPPEFAVTLRLAAAGAVRLHVGADDLGDAESPVVRDRLRRIAATWVTRTSAARAQGDLPRAVVRSTAGRQTPLAAAIVNVLMDGGIGDVMFDAGSVELAPR